METRRVKRVSPHRQQGDFCVSMIGCGALRRKKQQDCCTDCSRTKEAKSRAVAHEMDLGKRKMKKISTHQQMKLLRNGPTRGVFNCNRQRPPKPIATIQAYSKEDQQKKKTLKNGRQGEFIACVLRVPRQVTCSNDALAARRERNSPAPAQPSPARSSRLLTRRHKPTPAETHKQAN